MTLIIILLLIVGIPIVGLFIRVWREDSQKNREAEEAAREKVRQAEETQEEFRQKQAEEKQNREALCARMANHPVFRQITSGLEEFVDDILEVAKTTVILSSVCEVIRVEVKNDSVIASHVLNEQVLSKRNISFQTSTWIVSM